MENKKNITGDDLAHRAEMELNGPKAPTVASMIDYLRREATELEEVLAAHRDGKTEIEGIFNIKITLQEAANCVFSRLQMNCTNLKDLSIE